MVGNALRGLHFDGAILYLDDILIWGADRAEFCARLDKVLTALAAASLYVSPTKCVLAAPEILFLGHVIRGSGMSVDPVKTEAIAAIPPPRSPKEVRAFLGMLNFHGEALPGLQPAIRALNALTSSKLKRLEPNAEQMAAFEAAKRIMAEAAELTPFDPNARSLIVTDASDIGCGAGFYQRDSDESPWRPLCFYSKGFNNPTYLRWPTWQREMFGLLAACRQWAHWILAGKDRTKVWTDNSVVVHFRTALFGSTGGQRIAKVMRWAAELGSLPIAVRHLPGEQNVVADFLSRTPVPGLGTPARVRTALQGHTKEDEADEILA
jgi:hypothetical protein